ncbi:MAG: exodeoxyribonuclease VII large subunit [Alphaproteobacteria bacterium]|nr:exodeoxyribonuclease VII large subunit [Alphaproteobacteria bacterium]
MSKAITGNIPEYSVGELSAALRRTVEEAFGRVRVRGEISGFKHHSSGHLYFSLKDMDGVLAAVCWRGVAGALRIKPEDGLEVVATGRITTYPGQSKYQIVVESLEAAGIGAWLALLEERRKKLTAEGLFAAERKRKPPFLPEVIGVVTSPTGAVIRDILHRLADRFPRHVLVWPVAVQGEGAAAQVAAAIQGFNALARGGPIPRPDVIIVARGGGSIEDLWAFNEEIVVRAAALSAIPLIAAIGHETDVTLIDLAADVRAPTPTAAAEMAVPVRAELLARIATLEGRLVGSAQRLLEGRRVAVAGLARGLPDLRRVIEIRVQGLDNAAESLRRVALMGLQSRAASVAGAAARLRHPREVIADKRARLSAAVSGLRPQDFAREISRLGEGLARHEAQLGEVLRRLLADLSRRLAEQGRLLEGLGYQQVLARGFILARDIAGRPVTSAAGATPGRALTLTFHDGERGATVIDGTKPVRSPPVSQGKLL